MAVMRTGLFTEIFAMVVPRCRPLTTASNFAELDRYEAAAGTPTRTSDAPLRWTIANDATSDSPAPYSSKPARTRASSISLSS